MASAPLNEEGNPDADLITGTGFYKALNNVPFSGWNYVIEVQYSENADETQYAWDLDDLYYLAIRKKRSGVWEQWEYVNPPLQIGVEYRTVERYGGKPVYVQSINFGTLPNASSKSLNHNIQNYGGVVSYTGRASYYNLIGHPGVDSISIAGGTITIVTNANLSTQSAIITLKYIKTTD